MQSIASPVIDHTVTKQRTTKKGNVITTTTRYALTGSQMLMLAIVYGIVNLRALMGGPSALGDTATDIAEGTGAYFSTLSTYGIGFMNKWRGWNHDERMEFRNSIGKASTWVPPGYPSFWK